MFVILAIVLFLAAIPAQAASAVDPVFGKIDLSFERNDGQTDPKVKFFARGPGYGLFLTNEDAVIRFTTPKSSTVRMRFLGRNRKMQIDGVDKLAGTTNYLLGNGPARFSNVPTYKKVRYSDVYPGINVEYHGNGRLLEYDFVVKPGSDPSKIRIGFSGIRGSSIDSSGDLVLKTDADSVVQKKPRVYQEIDGREQLVEAAYLISGDQVGFKIGMYDNTKPLIIDPIMVYSTYFGGSGAETPYGIAVDSSGAVYVVGATTSTDLPVASAAQGTNKGGMSDAFVFKLDPTGTQVVYSTYIGGSATDEAHGIAVDAGGNAYITGYTLSNDFPIVNGFQKTRAGAQEAYFVKLNSSGTAIAYSTFLGGSADDRGSGIAIDAGNNAYITGITASTNFPTVNPYQRNNGGGFFDGFVAKIGAAGNLVYSTYVGAIGNDNPLSIAVDGIGAAYVTGWTTSVNFPIVNGFQTKFSGRDQPVGTDDVFVFKLNAAGTALDYSTYVGGTGSDEATRIALDTDGNAYVTGYTSSVDFPTVRPYQTLLSGLTGFDAFIFKLAPDGKSLVFSTYWGGSQTESGTGIAVDAAGAVYVSGYTTSFDMATANEIQTGIGGDRDAFVLKLDPGGNVLVFSTFLGGSGADSATGLALDSAANVYITGLTNSTDFKIASPFQGDSAGNQDGFVTKLSIQDILASASFQISAQGAGTIATKGTRTDAVFGYATADSASQMTALAIIDRKQNGATVSEVGIAAPPLLEVGRLFVDVTSSGRSVLSIANPSDTDASIDLFYTNDMGTSSQFVTVTVTAHQHFSRFVTDDPLNITAPGTLNFTSSQPVAATAFFTITNESGELLLSQTPIINPFIYSIQAANKLISIPELAEGGGWQSDIVLVNPSEDRMNGEVRFVSEGSGDTPGAAMVLGIGDGTTSAPAVEFDIPARSFQKISTAGNATTSEASFVVNQGTSIKTPGGGSSQISGFASADSTDPNLSLNGLEVLEYRQLGITESQAGVLAPKLRQKGTFWAEVTDKIRSFITMANPYEFDVNVDIVLTDENGSATGPITVPVPAKGQFTKFLSDTPISMATNTARTVTFDASLPVFVSALRYLTNERNDTVLSAIPVFDMSTTVTSPVIVPHFTDGAGWKTQLILVNDGDAPEHGDILFLGQGIYADPLDRVDVGTANGPESLFEYNIPAHSFFRLQTDGQQPNVAVGSIFIVPFDGYAPASYAIVSDLVATETDPDTGAIVAGNTTLETPIEGQVPGTSFRMYAEASGDFINYRHKSTTTTIAVANPYDTAAIVQLDLTSFDGTRLGVSTFRIVPHGQAARYLFQLPGFESLPSSFQGTLQLTLLSGVGVTAASFRIMINERSDYLVTTTGPFHEDAGLPGHLMFPYMTDSTGYTTQFVLVNPPGVRFTPGVLHYLAADGTPLQIDTLMLGSIQVVPYDGFNTPHAHVILNQKTGGVLTFLTSVEGQFPGSGMRMYAELLGDFDSGTVGSTRTGIALANPSDTPATVRLELRALDGSLVRTSQPFQIPVYGETSMLLNQVPGFENLGPPFEGTVRVVALSAQGITAAAFRGMYNERGNVLFTTVGPLNENAGTPSQVVFPHIAEGGGYTTQFVLIGGPQPSNGTLNFFNEEGNPLNVTLTGR